MLKKLSFAMFMAAAGMASFSASAKSTSLAKSTGTACGVFNLNAYGQGCSVPTIRAGECPSVGLTIWPHMHSTDILIHTSIRSEVANAIEGLKCICMDYRLVYGRLGNTTFVYREPTSEPRACGRPR